MNQSISSTSNGSNISDHRLLADLGNALNYAGSSALRLRDAVDGYFKAIETAMEQKIDEVRLQLKAAEQALSTARSILSSCREARVYDEENDSWDTPDCSCEERDVREAEKEVSRIHGVIDKLERIKGEVGTELFEYRQPVGVLTPGGGGGILEWLGESLAKEATEKMERILEQVEKYMRVNVSIKGGSTISSRPADMDGSDSGHSGVNKKEEFRRAIERIADRQAADDRSDHQLNSANAVVICQNCHRPIIACICARDQREHFQMFNHDFSR